jgi:thiol:disulfide interchange protein
LAVLAASLQLALVGCSGPAEVSEDARLGTDEAEAPAVVWEEDWQAAFDRARSEGRIVVATFRADWCIWCHRLEQGTLSEPDVARFLSGHAVALRLDVEGDGRSQASQLNVRTLPTVIGFSADGSELGRIVGYSRPQRFLSSVEAWTGPNT